MVYAQLAEGYISERVLYDIYNVCPLSPISYLYNPNTATVDPTVSNPFVQPG